MHSFNPHVWKWFEENLGHPTEVQKAAWPAIKKGEDVLIAAPTGSGKTLAAFYSIIDDLVTRNLEEDLPDKTLVVYVSPLKALSNDIEKNLRFPLSGITQYFKKRELGDIKLTIGLRTGDTTASQRTAMFKKPPHILVSTPESLYILLTSENGRKMLSQTTTVIVDEIHALVGNKRGSHLSLSLERLQNLVMHRITRVGLSATQKPIKLVADFLTCKSKNGCQIIDTGHQRKLDLSLELPRSPLSPVMANEVWEEIYDRLEELILNHKTTLIFTNTRRLAERMAHNLSNRIGDDLVTAHHGSMSKEHRLAAERQLKEGKLKALVATASLELGIDIGTIDLVCQMGSPRSIAAFLQRVGRSGHSVKGTPKGILFPLSRDELVEAVAIFDSIKKGILDQVILPEKPLDILSQQIVAELSCREYSEDELFNTVIKAFPYRNLTRNEFDSVIEMLSNGFTTRRGRRGAYLHHDLVNKKLRARKNARLASLLSGGAIPDNFDYDVILEPSGTFVGTLNEDFTIESLPGDIFQLGNSSYRILKIENGKVRVEDARGAPPNIPFWFGEAPGRTRELSEAVSGIREEVSQVLGNLENLDNEEWMEKPVRWIIEHKGINEIAAEQLITYLASAKASLDVMPTREKLVMERFFDEAGDMHLVIHSPFGSRLNRAWGLALRKRFCRKFNFELQAAATEDNIILSLGATHSFKLDEVYQYLNPKTVRDVLIQALLDAPMFEVRWRWNVTRALAVLRRRGNQRVPPQIQRSQSEDLIALVFPDQLACLENIVGEREIPEHPLVAQTIQDCLTELMDIDELEELLTDIRNGNKELIARDLKEPSPLAQEILSAKPYSFLDNAPLEERRTNAVQSRGWLDPRDARDLAHLDQGAIELVRQEAWPEIRDVDDLHDALLLLSYINISIDDLPTSFSSLVQDLVAQKRAIKVVVKSNEYVVALERVPQWKVLFPQSVSKQILLPEKLKNQEWSLEQALIEIVRGRLEGIGPVYAKTLAESIGLPVTKIEQALMALENDGFVIRGHFTDTKSEEYEWCERRLLARIHRYTIQKLRKEIQPVNLSDFMRFLFVWQGLVDEAKSEGPEALQRVLEQLEGYEAPASAWEGDILSSRLKDYDFFWLDVLCMSGKIVWGRFHQAKENGNDKPGSTIKNSPISLIQRENLSLWKSDANQAEAKLPVKAKTILSLFHAKGALFFDDIVKLTGFLNNEVEASLGHLISAGFTSSDSYTGLRALLVPLKYKTEGRRRRKSIFTMQQAGRWSTLDDRHNGVEADDTKKLESIAKILLKRYGIVFRKICDREKLVPPWRDLVKVFRRMESRGEIRGGRFVEGVGGEQFALAEAIPLLRKTKSDPKAAAIISISAADPLNLTGTILPGSRIPGIPTNRILFKDGVPVAHKSGGEIEFNQDFDRDLKWELHTRLIQRKIPPKLKTYIGKGIG